MNVARRHTGAMGCSGLLSQQTRSMVDLPKGIKDSVGDVDDLIPLSKDRRMKKVHMPDFLPDDLKKDMAELGLEGVEDLDELEEKNMEGFNDAGLVPPDHAGTFQKPILIPSRKQNRVVGYTDPVSHATCWFTIENNDAHYYIKDLGLFFKLLHIPAEQANAHH